MKQFLIIFIIFSPLFSLADNLKVETKEVKFKQVTISAENLKAISFRLKKEIITTDCNQVTLSAEMIHLDGNKEIAYYKTAFINASVWATEMYCPREEMKETIFSEQMTVSALINENAPKGLVQSLKLIIPEQFDIEVIENK